MMIDSVVYSFHLKIINIPLCKTNAIHAIEHYSSFQLAHLCASRQSDGFSSRKVYQMIGITGFLQVGDQQK